MTRKKDKTKNISSKLGLKMHVIEKKKKRKKDFTRLVLVLDLETKKTQIDRIGI